METAGIVISQENTSEEKFMSDESLSKLLRSVIHDDIKLGLICMFKKYPKLMKFVSPCIEKGKEGKHSITYTHICRNSPLYDLGKNNNVIFDGEEIFDYLWT